MLVIEIALGVALGILLAAMLFKLLPRVVCHWRRIAAVIGSVLLLGGAAVVIELRPDKIGEFAGLAFVFLVGPAIVHHAMKSWALERRGSTQALQIWFRATMILGALLMVLVLFRETDAGDGVVAVMVVIGVFGMLLAGFLARPLDDGSHENIGPIPRAFKPVFHALGPVLDGIRRFSAVPILCVPIRVWLCVGFLVWYSVNAARTGWENAHPVAVVFFWGCALILYVEAKEHWRERRTKRAVRAGPSPDARSKPDP